MLESNETLSDTLDTTMDDTDDIATDSNVVDSVLITSEKDSVAAIAFKPSFTKSGVIDSMTVSGVNVSVPITREANNAPSKDNEDKDNRTYPNDACFVQPSPQSFKKISLPALDVNPKRKMSVLALNVCGLRRKMLSPDLLQLINDYDVVVLSETKLDDMDRINIPGFTVFYLSLIHI
eukprot:TRINITY_DN35768_c1_g1_i1.p1 TRINITY_DN35768_c1_g1~~TRINITY_DN35768_c1_g1_i1.p1  ORF type:complete len:178 (-),score=27.35 TRINITY_DN35768_c1_g1_i1:27-560(-)